MKLIDISHTLGADTPVYPGDNKKTLPQYKFPEKDHYTAYLLTSGLHTGTHIDVPMHLVEDDRTAADFPPDCFVGKGILLDVRGENPIGMKPRYREIIGDESIVLLYTGLDRYYYTETDKYFSQYPTVGGELADFLLSQKIKILGMDMPAPDYPPFTFHKALLANDIFVLENLTNLQSLSGMNDFEVIALPLKLSAEASPVRAVCRIYPDT